MEEEEDIQLDEYYGFRERALYVRPQVREIDLNKFPADGNEFIHWSRLTDDLGELPSYEKETKTSIKSSKSPIPNKKSSKNLSGSEDELEQSNICTDLSNSIPVDHEFIHLLDQSSIQFPNYAGNVATNVDETSKSPIPEGSDVWTRLAAKEFSDFANTLNLNRKMLEEKFPPKKIPNVKDEKKCCLFCLGSENFSAIYKEPCPKKQAHLPLLSSVLHLNQKELISILKHSFKWFLEAGMSDILAKWICAVFACLEKPLSKKHLTFLELFYTACREYMNFSQGEKELVRLHFISALLFHYFCVKAYKVKLYSQVVK